MFPSHLENHELHLKETAAIQKQFHHLLEKRDPSSPIVLRYGKGHSNTTRSKSYKEGGSPLYCGHFNKILKIDLQNLEVTVEPRVTMEQLVKALLPYDVMVPVIPEFKGITVGGAILGAAAESGSYRWGIFHDCAVKYKLLQGNGDLIEVSPSHYPELFHGMAGSYGSLGCLLSATLKLIPIKQQVRVRTRWFSEPSMRSITWKMLCIQALFPTLSMELLSQKIKSPFWKVIFTPISPLRFLHPFLLGIFKK